MVYTRREMLTLREAEDWLIHGEGMPRSSQIAREIMWFLDGYPGLAPAMVLSCRRTAFPGKSDAGLRLAFDREILWCREGLTLEEARVELRCWKLGWC